jgi:hypothetical protein
MLWGGCSAFAQAPAALSPEEGERALERALARQSVLVLPRGAFELEPSIEYTYRGSTDALTLVDVAGTPSVARENAKRDRVETRLALRAGLPWAAHVEARIPYVFVREDRALAGQPAGTENESGAGDVELGITKQLVEEGPSRAGWLGSLNWKIPSGRFRTGEPSPGGGFHALQGGITFVKRQDPMVFFGTGSYTYLRERRHQGVDIDPGNTLGLKLGAILAASPQTSIRGAFEVARGGRTSLDAVKVPGSDPVVATLQFGLGMLLTRRSLLDVQVSIGVTPDAPDFTVTAALPLRF